MHNFEESNFKDFDYSRMLDCDKVQYLVGILIEGLHFLTKEKVQHTFQ